MLLAHNFLKLILVNLKAIPYVAISLHTVGSSNDVEVGNEKRFLVKTCLTVLYASVMVAQWIHAWWIFHLSTLLLSMTYSVGITNMLFIAAEHYHNRNEIAQLLNAFIQFERRQNRKFSFQNEYKYNWHLFVFFNFIFF